MARTKIEYYTHEEMEYKRCKCCKKYKPLTDYRQHKRKWDGLQAYCISCNKKSGGK